MTDALEDWRKQIDALDEELITILARRIEIVKKIGTYKKDHNLPPLDTKRWQEVLRMTIAKGEAFNLSKSFIAKLYQVIHDYALEIEKNFNL